MEVQVESDKELVAVEDIEPKQTTSTRKKKSDILCMGIDLGTMNICCARSDSTNVKLTRNVFLQLDKDDIQISELSDMAYVQSEEGELFVIGDDAFRFSNIFGKELSRPMERGLISPNEISAIDVLTLMIKDLVGNVKDTEAYCSYSIPAEAIDASKSVTYHEKVFGRILGNLGINHTSVNEGMAVIYSECQKEKFSGVGISFGAGMVNVAVAFNGIEVLKFSTSRSGDWVDKSVAESLGLVSNRVTSVKENKLNLAEGYLKEKNKKTKRVLEALEYYYNALIEYTIKKLIKHFESNIDIELEESLPIVISGGTSRPEGFIDLFKTSISRYDLPFEIGDIRQASDPLTAVARGLLIKTMADVKK